MFRYSMKSHNRRKHQRWVNRHCRYVNKSIENDDLWLGRFYISQNGSFMDWFDDKSGGLMYVNITIHDKKTGRTHTEWYDGLELEYRLWWDLNDFIVNDCKVWEEVPDIRTNRIDYRKKVK